MTGVPNVAADNGPSSLACGMSSPLVSFHARVALGAIAAMGLARTVNTTRSGPNTYRLKLPLTAVLPSPKTSQATPRRGEKSFQFGTFGTSGKLRLRVGTHGPGPTPCAGT